MSVDERPHSPRQHGAQLDRLAALEEERRFLLRSLRDLEREHDAGDVDDDDYRTLRDGYTVRAAAVLRQIDEGRAGLPARRRRRWGRVALVSAGVVVVSIVIGVVLANAWGERRAGQEITGLTPGDDVRTVLVSARNALTTGDFGVANSLFGRVVQMERDRGVENPEPITYFGWTLALLAVNEPDQQVAAERLDAARLALQQAIEIDPTYADPHCFMAIVEYQFRDDAAAALPFIETCEASDPPADVDELVAAFADEIRQAAGG